MTRKHMLTPSPIAAFKCSVALLLSVALSYASAASDQSLRSRIQQVEGRNGFDVLSELETMAPKFFAELVTLSNSDPNGSVRYWSSYLLAFSNKTGEAFPILMKNSAQPNSKLGRYGAFVGMNLLARRDLLDASSRNKLRLRAELALAEREEALYIQALEALSTIADPKSVPILFRVLRRHGGSTAVGSAAIEALQSIKSESAKEALTQEVERLKEALSKLGA